MEKIKSSFLVSVTFLLSFVVFTTLVCFVDVRAIGPLGSSVGFSHLNQWFHVLTGVNMPLYTVTDWAGLVPLFVAFCFAVTGLVQWIKRKNLKRVDYSLFVLGGFYMVVMAAYALFETIVINYRPTLINGYLESSYPSSTTLLVLCVMPVAAMQFRDRIKNRALKTVVLTAITLFTVFMVVGRLISGVHWLTDIVGGALLSAGLVSLYCTANVLK